MINLPTPSTSQVRKTDVRQAQQAVTDANKNYAAEVFLKRKNA